MEPEAKWPTVTMLAVAVTLRSPIPAARTNQLRWPHKQPQPHSPHPRQQSVLARDRRHRAQLIALLTMVALVAVIAGGFALLVLFVAR
jgi:hypothetical protein